MTHGDWLILLGVPGSITLFTVVLIAVSWLLLKREPGKSSVDQFTAVPKPIEPGSTFVGRARMPIEPGDVVYWDHLTNTVGTLAKSELPQCNKGTRTDVLSLDSQEVRDMIRLGRERLGDDAPLLCNPPPPTLLRISTMQQNAIYKHFQHTPQGNTPITFNGNHEMPIYKHINAWK